MRCKNLLNRFGIVVRNIQRQPSQRLRHAGTLRDAQRREARTRLRKETVRVPVVTAFEFDDEIALRDAAGQPHRAHCGFGAT